MICRRCGCGDLDPCLNEWGEACAWAAPEVCTFCVTKQEFEIAELVAHYAVAHDIAARIPKYTAAKQGEALRLYRQATTNVKGATA